MAKYERQLNARTTELVRLLNSRLPSHLPVLELVDSAVQRTSSVGIYLFCYELAGSTATLQIVGTDAGKVTVTAIAPQSGEAFVHATEALLDEFSPSKS